MRMGIVFGIALATVLLTTAGCPGPERVAIGSTPLSQGMTESGKLVGVEGDAVGGVSKTLRKEVPVIETVAPKSAGVVSGQCDALDGSTARLAALAKLVDRQAKTCVELEKANKEAVVAIDDLNKKILTLNDEHGKEIDKLKSDASSKRTTYLILAMIGFIGLVGVCAGLAVWLPKVRYAAISVGIGCGVAATFCYIFTSVVGLVLGIAIAVVVFAAVVILAVMAIKKYKAGYESKTDQLNVVVKAIENSPTAKATLKPVIMQDAIDAKVSDALEVSVQAVT